MKQPIITLFVLLFFRTVLARTIEIDLPSCGRLDYVLCLFEGERPDTIATGNLDVSGKAVIALPERHMDYRGVGRLWIKDRRTLNVILNGEPLVSVNEIPGADEIDFMVGNSTENACIADFMERQRQIFERYAFVRTGLEMYGMEDAPYFSLKQEEPELEKRYAGLWKEINDSPLYAARMMEILNCLSGAGSSLKQPPKDVLAGQREFITGKLDFDDLYTSGFWELAMHLWYESALPDDSLLLNGSRQMLDRAGNILVRRELTQSLIKLFSKYGKDSLLSGLGTEYLTMPLNGQPAPVLKTDELLLFPKSSLLVFFETGCGSCHNELAELKKKYPLLKDNKVCVISISADIDKDIYEEASAGFPWTSICDFKGFDGENFINYGIAGTPTFVLVDSEGIVRGRYARINELLK